MSRKEEEFKDNMKLPYLLSIIVLGGCTLPACEKGKEEELQVSTPVEQEMPETSTFFATAFVEQAAPYDTPSDGDLWPAAWSDDDFLYSANGDGKGFDLNGNWADIVINRISGHPADRNIMGERLSSGEKVGSVWSDPVRFNRKPTGMVSVDGVLYLAVQDLGKEGPSIFNEAPAASILRSDDKGNTWEWDEEAPMFNNHTFTTIMFLDYGKDGRDNTFDDYVYAYGMDHNWRDSFSGVVPDPNKLFLARIPKDGLQDVNTWEFYTGDLAGNENWSAPGDLSARKPVLEDKRRRYKKTIRTVSPSYLSVISQGSMVYNKPLDRYIYTSWTEYTFEFYEAPTPWGPWKLFLSKDFGAYPWSGQNFGGYATVAPSKYISNDGTEMWVSSSTFMGEVEHYNFSLRRLWVTPYQKTEPENSRGETNLALSKDLRELAPVSAASIRKGKLTALNDGDKSASSSIDSYSVEAKEEDFWGYTWSRAYNLNNIIYTTGSIDASQGGWFKDIRVQVRQNFEWVDVENPQVAPSYSYNNNVKANTSYTLTFDANWGDGVRITGAPGGKSAYTSIAELEVYYR